MCDVDHALCSICCKSGYRLRKWCRVGKEAKQMCNLSFCVAYKVSEKKWVCGRCTDARQRREAKDMVEKEERTKRLARMETVRRAMEARTGKMEARMGKMEVGTGTKTREGTADVRNGVDIKRAMEIGRLVNEEGKESCKGWRRLVPLVSADGPSKSRGEGVRIPSR